MKKSTATTANPVAIVVNPVIRHLFDNTEIRGQGGFQSLCRSLAARLETAGPILKLDRTEFGRIVRYASTYGEGGFQTRLRVLVTHWVAQHPESFT